MQPDDIEFDPDDFSDVPGSGTDGEPFSLRRARQDVDPKERDPRYEEDFKFISQLQS